ncbi:transmembrane protein, partial [Cystoisospora suis]
MSIPGVDPSGYYFMEYLRASLLRLAIEMIRLPNSTLFFLMIAGVCLRPTYSFRLSQETGLISGLSCACLVGSLLVWAYAWRIEKQLLPRQVPHYLVMRYHMEVGGGGAAGAGGGGADSRTEYLKDYTPPYKLQKQKNAWPGVLSNFCLGTTLPNKHQQLFCFWANGPSIVLRALEASFFCQLLVLAWWIQLFRSHPSTWLSLNWWGSLVVGLCAFIQFALLKSIVYTVLLALNSGMLVDPDLLEKVWDLQRAENVRRTAELIDALRVQSTLFAISEGGDIFWRQLLI